MTLDTRCWMSNDVKSEILSTKHETNSNNKIRMIKAPVLNFEH